MFVLVSFLCERFSTGWNTQQAFLFLFPDAVFKSRSWKKLYVSCRHICWWRMEMNPWVLISYWWLEDGMWCLLGTGRRGKGFTVTLTNAAPILPFTAHTSTSPPGLTVPSEWLSCWFCCLTRTWFSTDLTAQQLQCAQNLFPVFCAAYFHVPGDAGQYLLASPLKELLPWSKFS